MTVLVGSPCGKNPVCDVFYDCFYGLRLPEGSIAQRARSGSVSQNLNVLIDNAVNGGFDYLFIVEDDSMFHPDSVLKLLAHDKDVVTGLCLQRHPPFLPYIYEGFDPTLGFFWRPLKDTDEGLIKVTATGMGGILIKTEVFKKLKRPYFSTYYIDEKEWGQDIVFNKQLMDAGIEVFCDTSVTIWHATNCSIAAIRENGEWMTVIRVADSSYRIK